MAGHALYGMAPCFGHTGVTFDAENDRPGPGSLRGHFEAARSSFLRLKALFATGGPPQELAAKRLVDYYTSCRFPFTDLELRL